MNQKTFFIILIAGCLVSISFFGAYRLGYTLGYSERYGVWDNESFTRGYNSAIEGNLKKNEANYFSGYNNGYAAGLKAIQNATEP